MRIPFVHEILLRLQDGADPRGPGAAVTAGLCGHWEHEGPCRWPHLSAISDRAGNDVTLRVLFVAELEDERDVRSRIVGAVRRGRIEGAPRPSAWTVLRERRDELRPEEAPQAERLVAR